MAYQTGSAASSTALKSIIEAFAQANGWTLTGQVLSNGASFVQLTSNDSGANGRLEIRGANDVTMTAGLCSQFARITIGLDDWPVTYHAFALAAPTPTLIVFLRYKVTWYQWIGFGELEKYTAWTGGNWFGASHGEFSDAADTFHMTATTSALSNSTYGYRSAPGAPFWGARNFYAYLGTYEPHRNSFVHAEIDGNIWPGEGVIDGQYPSFCVYANPVHKRMPNQWNSHTPLLPFFLHMPRADGHVAPLGHIPHLKHTRLDYLEVAEIVTIGTDKWMVFPWVRKNLAFRDGSDPSDKYHSGTWGVAIAYDGP